MKQNEIFRQISRIVHDADCLSAALSGIRAILATEWGGAVLIIRPASTAQGNSFPPAISEFLESREYPFRGLYTAPLRNGARTAGTLVACIGSFYLGSSQAFGDSLRAVTDYAGNQLADLARRLALPALEYAEAA